ncbi:hypothetical protein PUN28_007874 [Cardiocondyla obscurior]|uniref:Uncharacterized protein n=1 Tax=Cardiocondyla obscurior TaxID=286306 RepID=A0AAW2FY05_9HYME
MRKSLSNNAAYGRPYGARHMYNWKTHENVNNKDYQFAESNSYQRFSANDGGSQSCDNFIPLNANTPTTQREKYNFSNRHSPTGRGSPSGGWHNNYRNNYATPRPQKHHFNQAYGQKRKNFYKQRQVNLLAYVDVNSFLEDPWEELVQKLNDSQDTSKSEEVSNKSVFNSELFDNNLTDKSENKLLMDTNVNDLQCSPEDNKCSISVSSETQNANLGQISKVSSSVELESSDICSSQDKLENLQDKSTHSISENCKAMQEKNIYLNTLLIDNNQKDV